jgi:large subunit ribosomal protein L35
MPKMKTHKGIKKRMKATARGKVKYFKRSGRHLQSSKSAKRKAHIKRPGTLDESAIAKKMLRLLGEE